MLGVFYRLQGENTSYLGHGFNLKNTRHNRVAREVTLKKRLIDGYIFASDNATVIQF